VPFVCNHNAGRSQMAQAFFERYSPNDMRAEVQLHADRAVPMGCADACPYVASAVDAWDITDPAGRPLDEVRAIRDGIQADMRELIAVHADEVRSDGTAHQLRLARLLPMLAEEFADTRSPEEIRACADAILDRFDGLPVRTHLITLAHRSARRCLRSPTCGALARAS
jgi:hypothetical protein